MLQNTFVHIPRVSRGVELKIWQSQAHSWQDFLNKERAIPIPSPKKSHIIDRLHSSIDALKKKDFSYFSTLPQNQHWRMYSALKDKACFLDIETTGLSKERNDITLIGIHGDEGTKIFMKGKNLEKFEDELRKYQMIVTFNGRCFDIPFIKTKFPETIIDHYHADLRFIMAELGFRGGLKNVERARGITRDEEVEGMDGFEAVILWHRYQRGDNSALAKLKKYLSADVENLKSLMDAASIEMKKKNFYDVIQNSI
jgi:uncharacterized protein